MKRFYYNVKQFTPETEWSLDLEQYNNDAVFIYTVFHVYRLHPKYSARERFENGMNYTGYLDYQLYNWEGDKLEWLNHTLFLFNNEFDLLKKYEEKFTKENLEEFYHTVKWLNDKREEYQPDHRRIGYFLKKRRLEKIKWIAKPSQFCYFFLELLKMGYIDPPKYKDGNINFGKFARICFDKFDLKITEDTLIKEINRMSGSLDYLEKLEFTVPDESKLIIPERESGS